MAKNPENIERISEHFPESKREAADQILKGMSADERRKFDQLLGMTKPESREPQKGAEAADKKGFEKPKGETPAAGEVPSPSPYPEPLPSKPPLLLNKNAVDGTIRTGFGVGLASAIPSYLTYVGGVPQVLASAGLGGLGYLAAKKLRPNSRVLAPTIGATAGVLSAPFVKGAGAWVASIASSTVGAPIIGFLGGAAGGNFIGKMLGMNQTMRSGLGIGTGLLSGYAASTNATAGSGALTTALSHMPATALSTTGLASASNFGLLIGGGAAALYGMGRFSRWMQGAEKEGMFRTMLRGAVAPIVLPYKGIMKGGSFIASDVKETWNRNVEGVKRMFKGESKIVKAVSAPLWWPVRSTWRFGSGMFKGAYNGLTRSEESEFDKKQGPIGELGRIGPYYAGRAIRFPFFDFLPWAKKKLKE